MMIVAFFISSRRLYISAGRKFTFDQFVLTVESLKLILYLVEVFLYQHQEMLVMVSLSQSLIQFFIAVSFLNRVLT